MPNVCVIALPATQARTASWSLIPGSLSVERAESTAQGRTASIASRDVLGAEAAREHHAALPGAGALEVRRVVGLPGQVDDGSDLLAVPPQDAVARPVPVLAVVELDEVGAGLVLLADEDRDAEHGLGCVEQLVGAARALPGEDEADEVGARLDGGVDVLLAREPADLDERP